MQRLRIPERLRERARALKNESYALYLALRSPDVPWYAKVIGAVVIGYVLSPIDLIPDFIPVIGLLDDLVIVPAGIALVIRLVPREVMARCRERAKVELAGRKLVSRTAAVAIVIVWLAVLAVIVWLILRKIR